jgi:tetratricopeptide (TPR) repeat protein
MTHGAGPSAARCASAEDLAALLDGRLPPHERQRIEAHIAECETCYDWFAEIATLQDDAAVDGANAATDALRAAPPGRRWRTPMVGAGLAAAAAIWLAVAPPASLIRWWMPDARPELQQMVAAVGPRRATVGRITGGFEWGPRPSVTRGLTDEVRPEMRLALARLAEEAERAPTARALAARGSSQLAAGQIDPAIRDLEAALAADDRMAFAWSDLAAAYIGRRSLTGEAQDAVRARDAARRALAINPELPEARFNLALALEATDPSGAIEALQQYLGADSSSPWAVEAKALLDQLQSRRRQGPGAD